MSEVSKNAPGSEAGWVSPFGSATPGPAIHPSCWATILVRGAVSMVFGLLLLLLFFVSPRNLAVLFGFYAIADGCLAMVSTVQTGPPDRRRWLILTEGLISVAAGALALAITWSIMVPLSYLIVLWGVVRGVAFIYAHSTRLVSVRVKIYVAALSVVFAGGTLAVMGTGILVITLSLALYLLLFEVAPLALGLRLYRIRH